MRDWHPPKRKFITITSLSTLGNQKRAPKPSWPCVCNQISPRRILLWGNAIIGWRRITIGRFKSSLRPHGYRLTMPTLDSLSQRSNAGKGIGRKRSMRMKETRRSIRKTRMLSGILFLRTPLSADGRKHPAGRRKCERWRRLLSSPRFKVVTSIFGGRATSTCSSLCSVRFRQEPIRMAA